MAKCGNWYHVFESFENGNIRMTIIDTRDNSAITGVVEDLETHTEVWEALSTRIALDSLPSIEADFFK